jgi:DnaK suppressor protein
MTSTLTPSDRPQFEQRLRERRIALQMEIRETLLQAETDRDAQITGQSPDAQEHALADQLGDVTNADVARDAGEIRDIEAALERLAAGTYGECLQCGAKIPRSRLNAYPTAKRCLPCQQAHEQAVHRMTATPG